MNFYRKLRADYHPQSVFQLQRRLKVLEEELRQQLVVELKKQPHVNITFDGWEDHQRCPTMGYTLVTLDMRVFLWQFTRLGEKQTSETLSKELMKVVVQLSGLANPSTPTSLLYSAHRSWHSSHI